MHWLMKRLGQSVCKHAKPNCPECPLRSLCAYALRAHPEHIFDTNERDAEIRDRPH
jgi:adenine-specific DNA glycosylase